MGAHHPLGQSPFRFLTLGSHCPGVDHPVWFISGDITHGLLTLGTQHHFGVVKPVGLSPQRPITHGLMNTEGLSPLGPITLWVVNPCDHHSWSG